MDQKTGNSEHSKEIQTGSIKFQLKALTEKKRAELGLPEDGGVKMIANPMEEKLRRLNEQIEMQKKKESKWITKNPKPKKPCDRCKRGGLWRAIFKGEGMEWECACRYVEKAGEDFFSEFEIPSRYENYRRNIALKLPTAKSWVEDLDRKRPPAFLGNVGCGKTQMLYSIGKMYLEARNEARFELKLNALERGENPRNIDIKYLRKTDIVYFSCPQLFHSMRMDLEKKGGLLERLQKVELFILDDLGAERQTDWTLDQLYLLIDHRYTHELPIVWASNYTIKELSEQIGERIVSRLVEISEIVKMKDMDYRMKRK